MKNELESAKGEVKRQMSKSGFEFRMWLQSQDFDPPHYAVPYVVIDLQPGRGHCPTKYRNPQMIPFLVLSLSLLPPTLSFLSLGARTYLKVFLRKQEMMDVNDF